VSLLRADVPPVVGSDGPRKNGCAETRIAEDAAEPSLERAHWDEVVRRKELVLAADQLIVEANEHHKKRNFKRAVELYLQALDKLELAGRAAPITRARRVRTADGAYNLYLDWAEALARKASAQSRSEWMDRAIEKCHAAGNAFPERKQKADATALKLHNAKKQVLFRELISNVQSTQLTWGSVTLK